MRWRSIDDREFDFSTATYVAHENVPVPVLDTLREWCESSYQDHEQSFEDWLENFTIYTRNGQWFTRVQDDGTLTRCW